MNNLSLLKIINGLSKTINIANQMLPLYTKIKPLINNASQTLNNINFSRPRDNTQQITKEIKNTPTNNSPTFFQ